MVMVCFTNRYCHFGLRCAVCRVNRQLAQEKGTTTMSIDCGMRMISAREKLVGEERRPICVSAGGRIYATFILCCYLMHPALIAGTFNANNLASICPSHS